MNSLRWKLLVGLLGGISLLLSAAGAVGYMALKERLVKETDRALTERALSLAAMIENEAGRLQVEWLEQENDPPQHLAGIDYFALWRKSSGEVVAASPDLHGLTLPRFGGPLAKPELRDSSPALMLPTKGTKMRTRSGRWRPTLEGGRQR
jgi:hypothetical protein